jgi:uncharacterized membrane protein (GlpM family)
MISYGFTSKTFYIISMQWGGDSFKNINSIFNSFNTITNKLFIFLILLFLFIEIIFINNYLNGNNLYWVIEYL